MSARRGRPGRSGKASADRPVRRQRPTQQDLERIFPPDQTFTFSGIVRADGSTSEGHHVTENMTPEQRALYGLWWTTWEVLWALERVLREQGLVGADHRFTSEEHAELMWSTYERLPDDEWEAICAPKDPANKAAIVEPDEGGA